MKNDNGCVMSYASVVGELMYTMLCTIPNITFIVNVTSKYQVNLKEKNWLIVKSIIKYLRRTKDHVLS